jgi:hypothetical protein
MVVDRQGLEDLAEAEAGKIAFEHILSVSEVGGWLRNIPWWKCSFKRAPDRSGKPHGLSTALFLRRDVAKQLPVAKNPS